MRRTVRMGISRSRSEQFDVISAKLLKLMSDPKCRVEKIRRAPAMASLDDALTSLQDAVEEYLWWVCRSETNITKPRRALSSNPAKYISGPLSPIGRLSVDIENYARQAKALAGRRDWDSPWGLVVAMGRLIDISIGKEGRDG